MTVHRSRAVSLGAVCFTSSQASRLNVRGALRKGGRMSSRQLGMNGYIGATCGVAVVLTCAFLQVPDLSDLGRLLLFAGLATAAQLRPTYLSSGMKVTAEDVATFAAALTLGPFAAALVAGASTLVGARRWPGEGRALWFFNASVATLGTISAALV